MSDSNLFPQRLGGSHPDFVFVWTISLSFVLCLMAMYLPNYVDIGNIPIILSFPVYISDLVTYYRLQRDFDTLERHFKSPFGVSGAIVAGLIFLFSFIALLGFVNVEGILPFFFGFIIALTIFYYYYTLPNQKFSKVEQHGLFHLHVIIFNQRKRRRLQRKKKFHLIPHVNAISPAP